MLLIKLYDVIIAIKDGIKTCVPEMEFYLGRIPESPSRPSILILRVRSKNTRSTFLSQVSSLSLQLINFVPLNDEGEEELLDKLETEEKLKPFLNKYLLKVGDRCLNFEYDIGEADDQLSIILDFKFKDSIVITQEDFEMIENISLNEEAIS